MNKKSSLILTLVLTLLLCGCGSRGSATTPPPATLAPIPTAATGTPQPTPEPSPTAKALSPEVQALTAENKKVWSEMSTREWMEGRLVIPSAGIDVALFSWGRAPEGESDPDKALELVRQQVVDDPDSAILYYDAPVGNIIADHSTQDFAALTDVKVGDAAYILSGERILTLRCDLVTDGVNTGNGITDKDGGWQHEEDYTCYTCLEDWTHVQLVGFTMTDEDFFDVNWIDQGGASSESTGSSTGTPGAVVTTVSLPAPTADPAASAGPSPTPTPMPTQTAAPQAAPPQAAPQNNDNQAPVDYVPPSYDIYADSNGGNINIYDSGDGYLS